MFLFWIIPILLSYFFGKTPDVAGRKILVFCVYGVGILGLISLYATHQTSSVQISSVFLILGIFLLAIAYAIFRPISFALIGDIATERNLVSLTALFWMAQNIGILSALFISDAIPATLSYLFAVLILFISLIIFFAYT